ncbi:MAG: hypothetical protein C5B55_03370 [Blastocatellia bacterium]|nr:MAG: hypothetical protein C5B55_03370 [Blastocatellia bacterium]
MIHSETAFTNDYGPQRLTIELVNICNLHCSYCFRAEDALYNSKPEFLSVPVLRKVLSDAKRVAGTTRVIFTGGEPTLHPEFETVLSAVAESGMKSSFVTNGWHFERVWPAIAAHRDSVTHVAFSLDGITREENDRWRGGGSFDRLVRAFARCHFSSLPFAIKVVVRRDNSDQLEQIAIFAARMGANALHFVHTMPTSAEIDNTSLALDERRLVEEEVAVLSRIFKMNVAIDVGYYNIDAQPPCSPLAGTSMNIDYRGRLSLCCNLSGFRNGTDETDVVADLNVEPFVEAHQKMQDLSLAQHQKRINRLATMQAEGVTPDLFTGSPCLFCLHSFTKVPWHNSTDTEEPGIRSLPVFNSIH